MEAAVCVFYIVMRGWDCDVKAVLCCVKFVNGDVRHNICKITSACEKFSGSADMLVFGEAFLQGFDGLTWEYEKDKYIAVTGDSPEIAEICEAAKKNDIAVCFGYMERMGEEIYSSYMVVSGRGEIVCNYRRMSVGWKVQSAGGHYKEGGAPAVFDMNGLKFGVALCGDLWTDDVAECIKACRPDVILWPVYTDFEPDVWNTTEKWEYAERAAVYCSRVLLVNSVRDGEGFAKGGGAYFADGRIMSEVPAGDEGLLEVKI